MEKSRRRKPAKERWIEKLADQDLKTRIRVLGSILDIQPGQDQIQQVILDDGTGHIRIIIDNPSIPLELGNQIRVFGILRKTDQNEYIIEAEITQDMKDLDIELYKRVQKVKQKYNEKSK